MLRFTIHMALQQRQGGPAGQTQLARKQSRTRSLRRTELVKSLRTVSTQTGLVALLGTAQLSEDIGTIDTHDIELRILILLHYHTPLFH